MLYPANMKVRDSILDVIKQARMPDNRTIKSLVMLSGGLDSVALLCNLLEHTTHDIHAHHIEINNFEKRSEAENDTLEKIFAYIKKEYRPFTYSTSKYEMQLGKGGGLDMTLAMFMAARVVVATDAVTELVWTGHLASPMNDYMEASGVFTAYFVNYRFKPRWMVPLLNVRKPDIYCSIPQELAEMTWSCRTPRYTGKSYARCGQCHSCVTRAQITAELKPLQKQQKKR